MRRVPLSVLLVALLGTQCNVYKDTLADAWTVPSYGRSTVGCGYRNDPAKIHVGVFQQDDAIILHSTVTDTESSVEGTEMSSARQKLTQDLISKLRFRELQSELEQRQLSSAGTTSQLRERLRKATLPEEEEECVVNEDGIEDDCKDDELSLENMGVSFVDESDPDFEVKDLIKEIEAKCAKGHWKAATRKLKKLTRRYGDKYDIPENVYAVTLEACMQNRLQGARASEPARKVMEQMVEKGYDIDETVANYCIKNCLGNSGARSTHQGFGGIDTALAMLAAVDLQQKQREANGEEQISSLTSSIIQPDTYDKIIQALAKEGSVDQALSMLRSVVVDLSATPPLPTFAAVAMAAVAEPEDKNEEKVLTLLAYAKAAGYELDNIASTQDGRTMLACGVVAAERMNNVALGLRLLTAAGKATGVEPDRGDTMVALSSSPAQRACTLIHKSAIMRAVEDNQWKLSVKLLELMIRRSLRPSPWLWRNVVTCCAKAEKSKKATALLLDWVKLANQGKADKPPISVFNTCVNVCEICNEQELTLVVLDAMKNTHDTEGNIITFNIALKRLAKQGNHLACEGIIVGMIQAGVEPSVVSFTTAIAACVKDDNKQPALANEWIKRMRARRVYPNVLTYNTAFAACLDGTLESTCLASKLAGEMLDDVNGQLQQLDDDEDEEASVDVYTNVVPDGTTKYMARQLMKQLKKNWQEGAIDKRVATETIRVPLLRLVDFQKSEAAERARLHAANKRYRVMAEGQESTITQDEVELEIAAGGAHRSAEV